MTPGHTRGQHGPGSAAQPPPCAPACSLSFPHKPFRLAGPAESAPERPTPRLIHLGPGQGLKRSEPRGSLRRDPTPGGSPGGRPTRPPLVPLGHSWWPGASGLSAGSWVGRASPATSHRDHRVSASTSQECRGDGVTDCLRLRPSCTAQAASPGASTMSAAPPPPLPSEPRALRRTAGTESTPVSSSHEALAPRPPPAPMRAQTRPTTLTPPRPWDPTEGERATSLAPGFQAFDNHP